MPTHAPRAACVLVGVVCVLLGARGTGQAAATQCVGPSGVGLCTAVDGAGICHVTKQVNVAPDTLIDCSGVDVLVEGGNGRLSVTGGALQLLARNLTIESGRKVIATESSTSPIGVDITLTGSLTVRGLIRASNAGGGSGIDVAANGDIVLDRSSGAALDTTGTSQAVDGGNITLTSDQSVIVGGLVDADGKPCCGENNSNTGGRIDIQAGTDVFVTELIRTEGRFIEGGRVRIVAGRDVVVDGATGAGAISVNGEGATGFGGEVDLSGGNRVELRGPVNAAGGVGSSGGEAGGGAVLVTSGCGGVLVADAIDVTAGELDGGAVVVSSGGDVEVVSTIDASGTKDGGFGGYVEVDARGAAILRDGASILATGHTSKLPFADGAGGFVDVAGCQVEIEAGSAIDVGGFVGGYVGVEGRRDDLPPPTASSGESAIYVSEGSALSATGNTSAENGGIELLVGQLQEGVCLNNPGVSCTMDVPDCTVGCSTGDCVHANPDTDGQLSQFNPPPEVVAIENGGGCMASCGAAARAEGSFASAATTVDDCTIAKYRGAAKFGGCVGGSLGKAANDGLAAAQAMQAATDKCLPRLQKAFDRAGICMGAAGDIEASLNACITSYADDERHLFSTNDVRAERRAVKTFGKIVRCELLAHSKSPGQPEPARLFPCERNLLKRISSDDMGNSEGSIALRHMSQCVNGVVDLLGGAPLECTTDADCTDADPCTADVCFANLLCGHRPVFCLNGEECTPGFGCPECATDADCPGDGDACTLDVCNGGGCEYPADPCDETGGPCASSIGCVECFEDFHCDDGDKCTTDACAPDGRCRYTAIRCSPGMACDPASGQCLGAPKIPGDCDLDRDLDDDDAVCITRCLLSAPAPGDDCDVAGNGGAAADCDCNGSVQVSDRDECLEARGGGLPVDNDHCQVLRGDVDQDGAVTFADVSAVEDCQSNPTTDHDCYVAADCDCDGDVDSADESCTAQRVGGSPIPGDPCLLCPANAAIADTTPQTRMGVVGSVVTPDGVPVSGINRKQYEMLAGPVTVEVRDPHGVPFIGCAVQWTTGPSSGWIFAEDPLSDGGGARAWWVAGPASSQSASATLARRDGSSGSVTFLADVTPVERKQPSRFMSFPSPTPGPTPEAFAVEVVVRSNEETFFAGPVWHNHRIGIQSDDSGTQKYQFSVFSGRSDVPCCKPDCDPNDPDCVHCDQDPTLPPCKEPPDCHCESAPKCTPTRWVSFNNAIGVQCRDANDGKPCPQAVTCEIIDGGGGLWTLGDTVRLELHIRHIANGDGTHHTRFEGWFTDPDGVRHWMATIERDDVQSAKHMSAFIERLEASERTCLEHPIRRFGIKSAEWLPAGADPSNESNWVPLRQAELVARPVCQNAFVGVVDDELTFSVGGDDPKFIGPPDQHPNRGAVSFGP